MDVRDLGVQVDNACTFQAHKVIAIQKTRDKAAWVLRMFKSRAAHLMKTMWKVLVLPHLDYCSQLWSGPQDATTISDLEGPQRAFTKRISGFQNKSYWTRLRDLQLLSIERRFVRYKILYIKKVLLGMVPNFGIKVARSDSRRGLLLEVSPNKGLLMRHRTLREKVFHNPRPVSFQLPSQGPKRPCWLHG